MSGWDQHHDIETFEEIMRARHGRESLERECEASRHLIRNWCRMAKARLKLPQDEGDGDH